MAYERLGTHALANFYGCDPEVIGDFWSIGEIMYRVAKKTGFRIVRYCAFDEPVRGLLVLKTSHFSIHTLPEKRGAIVDIFTCGEEGSAEEGLEHLISRLPHEKVTRAVLQRGEYSEDINLSGLADPDFGTHAFGEFYGCGADDLAKVTPVRKMMNKVVKETGYIPTGDSFKQFEPEGVTGVVVFDGGHFTIHTWPEKGAVAVDLLQYGAGPSAGKGLETLNKRLTHKDSFFREI